MSLPPLQGLRGRLRQWGPRLLSLFVGQSFVQGMNFLTGMLLVRWLEPGAYAQYSLVFAFQCTLGMFVDLGFSGAIVSLVGARGERPEVIGGYIAAARWFRTGLFAVLVPLSAAVFFPLGLRHGWGWGTQGALFACVVVSLFFEGVASWYAAPLLIRGRLGALYRTQGVSSVIRLALCGLAGIGGVLGAVNLAVINTATYAYTGLRYVAASRADVRLPARGGSDPALRREMVRYLAPLMPGVAFTAVQGQLGLFLITWFGKTQNVAEVAALGRLGQLFILLGAVNGTLVMPYFARLPGVLLPRRYAQTVAMAGLAAGGLALAAFLFPAPLLWLLGGSYRHLEREFGWMVVGNGLSFVGGVLWAIHSARRWIFWWGSALYIGLLSAVQAGFIATVDLSTTLNVQLLGTAVAAATLLVHAATAVGGFRFERRESAAGGPPGGSSSPAMTHTILPDEPPVANPPRDLAPME